MQIHIHIHKLKHNWTHYLGLFSSGLCFVHCLLMPMLIPFMPAVAAYARHNIVLEGLFIGMIALTTITIFNGYRLHKTKRTLVFAIGGFTFLVTSLFLEVFAVQIVFSGIGSTLMLLAHYTNYKRCRIEAPCCDHDHGTSQP